MADHHDRHLIGILGHGGDGPLGGGGDRRAGGGGDVDALIFLLVIAPDDLALHRHCKLGRRGLGRPFGKVRRCGDSLRFGGSGGKFFVGQGFCGRRWFGCRAARTGGCGL